ncbi:hypothetical protein BDA99DRAFT_568763 [Phascolomyces articulosus]|uniref:Uncharacterized protein n=1 Tax=Phascolomyces articulosus TaxID=60185 RepID=A0AAD5K8R0_9FUNG|nr:hypothetical protein BDA99DRAFT_568763 [Phascolomyces articulosus]
MKWQPLPKIAHGIAVYPFTPSTLQPSSSGAFLSTPNSRPLTTYSTIHSPLLSPNSNTILNNNNNDTASIFTTASTSSSSAFPDTSHGSTHASDYASLIPLEVGDELFILEQQGHWYRGYVLSSLEEGRKPNTAPIGCFPRTHVQIKEYLDLDPAESLRRTDSILFHPQDDQHSHLHPISPTAPWMLSSHNSPAAEAPNLSRSLSESHITHPHHTHPHHRKLSSYFEQQQQHQGGMGETSTTVRTPPPPLPGSRPESAMVGGGLSPPLEEEDHPSHTEEDHHQRIISSSPTNTTVTTTQNRPVPSLLLARFDQSTITGSSEPLVDEIGACVSEWNCLLYKYLEERRYSAFNSVRDHINYLFQARRQLLDQALSREELSRLRKEIIHRMVMLNISQTREMIIRHPERGYILDANSTSLAMLLRMHWKYALMEHVPITTSFASSTLSRPSIAPSTKTATTTAAAAATSTPPSASSTISSSSDTQQQQQTQQQASSSSSSQHPKGAKFHHMFFELKAFVAQICQPGEFTELYFSLYNGGFITEQFSVTLTYQGMPTDERQIGKLQTLFADLSAHDLNDGLYLVCRIVRLGSMKYSDKEKDHLGTIGSHASMLFGNSDAQRVTNYIESASHYTTTAQKKSHARQSSDNLCRRPFGCAVLHIAPLLQKSDQSPSGSGADLLSPGGMPASATAMYGQQQQQQQQQGNNSNNHSGGPFTRIEPAEHDIRIYTATSESTFATLHEDIIHNNTKDFVKNARAEMLCVYLRMFYGQLDDVLKTNAALLQGVPRTSRLGFPDVVFPNDERNELYVTLNAGDFVQFARSKNVQVTICARDNITGDVIEHALTAGAGAPHVTYWESMVFYHEQRPRWGETLKVHIKEHRQWERTHLFITVRHRSSSNSSYHHHHSNSHHYSPPSAGGSPESGSFSGEKIVAMGFLPLFLPPLHRYFVADGTHTLNLYKYDRQLAHPRIYLDHVPWFSRSTAPFNMQHQEITTSVSTSSSRNNSNKSPQHQHSSSIHSLKSSHRAFGGSSSSLHTAAMTTTTSHSTSSSTLSDHTWSDASVLTAAAKLNTAKDTVTLTTFLCSTQFTQNETLVKLLNWRSTLNEGGDHGDLLSILDKFTFVGEMEVVKFLNDIFDALLDILVYRYKDEKRGETLRDEALAAIIWVLGIVQDRRFSNFRPVLDVYVEQRFSTSPTNESHSAVSTPTETNPTTRRLRVTKHEMVYDYMLKGMLRLCKDPSDPKKGKRLRASMKVWEYLLRFIVRSRGMQQQKEEDGERGLRDIMFKEELQQLLQLINDMMAPDQPSVMIGTQTLALQHFAEILGELRRVFSPRQLVDITTHFVNGCSHVTGKLIGYRLCMILAIVKGPVFNDHTCRSGLAKSVFKWIQVWLNSYMSTAKNIIFASRNNDDASSSSVPADHQQMRLPRVQWLEYLRLSLTIMSEILDKVRRLSGMASFGLSTSSVSSPSLSTLSRPISMATSGDEDLMEDSHTELMTITELALQLVPQLLNAYKDLQRLTVQAIHASGIAAESTAATADAIPPVPPARTSSRHSLSVLRDRSNSIGMKHSPSSITRDLMGSSSIIGGSGSGSISGPSNSEASKFSVVLQALATSPTTPFPSTYPFHATSIKNNPAIAATGNLAAMVTTGLFDITVVILELFYLTPRQQWVDYLQHMYDHEDGGPSQVASFLRQLVHACMAILFGDSMQKLEESNAKDDSIHHEQDETTETRKLPDSWLNLSVIGHQIVLNHIMAPALCVFEMPEMHPAAPASASGDAKENEENYYNLHDTSSSSPIEDVWRTFFVGLLRVMSSPRLDIEDFLPQTQRVVWKLAGNMKGAVGAKTLHALWKLAGPKKVPRAVKSASMLSAMIGNYSNKTSTTPSATTGTTTNGLGIIQNTTNNSSVDTIAEEDRFLSAEEEMSSAEDLNAKRASTGSKVLYDEEKESSEDAYQAKVLISRLTDEKEKMEQESNGEVISVDQGDGEKTEKFPEDEAKQGKEQVPAVSPLQLALIPAILRPLCGVSLTLHDKVRYTAVSILADIVAIELRSFETLSRVQNLLISTIDLLVMTENKGDEAIKSKWVPELEKSLGQQLREQQLPPLLAQCGIKAVDSISKFLCLLLQIRSLPLDNDEFVDDRISATLKLMEFVQVIQREDIYIKYVHQLVELHVSSSNYVEAALTLRFHADLLTWDPQEEYPAIPELNFPVQTAFVRKEKLYKDMIMYLEKGSAWELCIGLCKELAHQYENVIYDYIKLSEILQRQAQYAQDIVKKERYFAEYFRVVFYGRGFPPSLRHQQFIYRGLEWEKMASFVERMQNQHPNAQLLPSKYATQSILTEEQIREVDEEVDAQYLQITAVTAEPTTTTDQQSLLNHPLVPESIKKYYLANQVSHFSYSRPFDKGSVQQLSAVDGAVPNSKEAANKKPEMDFLNLWTKKTIFTCEETFPTTARRSKVVSVEDVEISPIENAVLAMENKNEELCALANKYSVHLRQHQHHSGSGSVNISPFSMALNGAVDAPVNGGVTLYKKAFLTDWYWEKNPEMRPWVRRLKTAINEQVGIIERGLEIHRKLVSSDMKPFHNTLVDFFKKNFKEEIEYVRRHKDTQQHILQENDIHPLDHHHHQSEESLLNPSHQLEQHLHQLPPSQSQQLQPSQPIPISQSPASAASSRPPLARQNSQQSTLSNISSSLPMSPVFSSMRSPTDTRPPSMMMEAIVDTPSHHHPPPAASRAESISRSLKMSLRKKKRPPPA